MRGCRHRALGSALLLAFAGYACGRAEDGGRPLPARGGAAASGASGTHAAGGAAGEGGTAAAGASAQGGGAGAGSEPVPSEGGAGGESGCVGEEQLVRGLSLRQAVVSQAVSVPIMEQLVELSGRNADIVSRRAALFRAYVAPGAAWTARAVRGRLTLVSTTIDSGTPKMFDDTRVISARSSDADLESTFNFSVPADAIDESSAYSIELFEDAPCEQHDGSSMGARFPLTGFAPLQAKAVGKLRVLLVPIEVSSGDSTLLPNLSVPQLESFRRAVVKLFPIEDVELSVREQPLATSATDMLALLDEVAALRDEENTDPLLTYYGAVRFVPDLAGYCSPSCVLGASFTGEAPGAGVAVGIGYSGDKAAATFVHELGHVYGRMHTPCGVAGDAAFPYSGGRIGSWGYDLFAGMLLEPSEHRDFMGYCSPTWVSDYVYQHLLEFVSATNEQSALLAAPAAPQHPAAAAYRTLILQSGRQPRWGRVRKVRLQPPGASEKATIHDAAGRVVTDVTVYRSKVPDLGAEVVYVPDLAREHRATLRLSDQPPVSLAVATRTR